MVNSVGQSRLTGQENPIGGGRMGRDDQLQRRYDNEGDSNGEDEIEQMDGIEIIPTPSNSDHSESTPTPFTPLSGGVIAESSSSSANNKSKSSSARVSKACVVCSLKKRRCDGGKPQCKVCMVLGTPCSYESRGLKRGPPKGFRAGPKESAKAKMLRSLETTIRDLTLHMGHLDTGKEIARISNERGIKLDMITMHLTDTNTNAQKKASAIHTGSSTPTGKELEGGAGSGSAEASDTCGDDDGDDVIGISEQGNFRYIGSSSGINLLQNQSSSSSVRTVSGTSPMDVNISRHKTSPRSTFPPIQLPTIGQHASKTHGSPSSNSALSSHDTSNPVGMTGMMDHHLRISRSMNQKLFHQYWTNFHPIWPILYKPALDMIHVDHLPTTLDTGLVYSIYAISICVANPPIDMEVETELGEGPASEIFAHFAEKFLFHHRDVPTPSFASIQTCFLLSCYHQGAGQLSKAYILSSLANTMAVDLGLHRHLHQYERDLIERESRNRIIHCIYILSTVLCSEMGRPPMLRSKDIDVPPMSESEKDEYETDNHGRQLHTASLLNNSRRLFAIIENVLTQVHSFRRKAALRRMGSEATRKFVDEIDHSLEVWKRSIPDYLKFPEDNQKGKFNARTNNESPVPSFVAVQIWYYTAQLLLHRPFIPQDEGLSLSQLLSDKYHQKCTQNAQSLFDMLLSLSKASSVDRLSTDFAYIIFTVAVMFVFNARLGHSSQFAPSADAATKTVLIAGNSTRQPVLSYAHKLSNDSKRQFLMCKEWLRKLSERWPSASSHKLLLDGFTNIGEGVVTGESGHQFMGRRPSLMNGSLIPASNDQQQQQGGREASPPSMAPRGPQAQSDMESTAYYSSSLSSAISNTGSNIYNNGDQTIPFPLQQQEQTFDGMQMGSSAQDIQKSSMVYSAPVAPQHSLNAYFEFPPNIFDMENVYWNETATRLTPLLGPRDGNNANSGNGVGGMSSNNFRTTPTPSSSSGPYNANQNGNMGYLPNTVPFTPRTLGAISAMSNYANTANHGPPQLPGSFVQSSSSMQSQQQSAPANIPMGPPTTMPSTMRSSGGGNNKEPLSNSPGLQILAQAITSVPDSSMGNKSSMGGGVGVGSMNNNNSRNDNQTNQPNFSPFSFHQEPSAPEWGDVISMLQLPPAFIQ